MVLTRQLFDAAHQASAHVIYEGTIWNQLSLNPVRLCFVWPSMAPVLRPAAGVRPEGHWVANQAASAEFYPFSVRSHWHRFGGRAGCRTCDSANGSATSSVWRAHWTYSNARLDQRRHPPGHKPLNLPRRQARPYQSVHPVSSCPCQSRFPSVAGSSRPLGAVKSP